MKKTTRKIDVICLFLFKLPSNLSQFYSFLFYLFSLNRNLKSCTPSKGNWMILTCPRDWWHRTHPIRKMIQSCHPESDCLREIRTILHSRRLRKTPATVPAMNSSQKYWMCQRRNTRFSHKESAWLCEFIKMALVRRPRPSSNRILKFLWRSKRRWMMLTLMYSVVSNTKWVVTKRP